MESLLVVLLVHLPIGLFAWLLSVVLWEKYRTAHKKNDRPFRFGATLIAIDLLLLWWEGHGITGDGLEGWGIVKLVAYVLIQGSLAWFCVKGYRWYKREFVVSVGKETLKKWITWTAVTVAVVFAYFWYWDFDPFSCPNAQEQTYVANAKAGVAMLNMAFETLDKLTTVEPVSRDENWKNELEKHLGEWVALAKRQAGAEPPTGRTEYIQQFFEQHARHISLGAERLMGGLENQDTSLVRDGLERIVFAMRYVGDVSWGVDSFCPTPQPPILGFPWRGQ